MKIIFFFEISLKRFRMKFCNLRERFAHPERKRDPKPDSRRFWLKRFSFINEFAVYEVFRKLTINDKPGYMCICNSKTIPWKRA